MTHPRPPGELDRSTPGDSAGPHAAADSSRAAHQTTSRSTSGKRCGGHPTTQGARALPEETGSQGDRIAVALSGGVDSSTAAALLVEAGHDVVGITLQLWDYTGVNLAAGKGRCCSPADVADARTVASHLGIPHYVFDHTQELRQQII